MTSFCCVDQYCHYHVNFHLLFCDILGAFRQFLLDVLAIFLTSSTNFYFFDKITMLSTTFNVIILNNLGKSEVLIKYSTEPNTLPLCSLA